MRIQLHSSDQPATDREPERATDRALVRSEVEVHAMDGTSRVTDLVAEEIPVALAYNGVSYAVMMTSPLDLEDFAIGFSLSEGILQSRDQLYDLAISTGADGTTIDMTIAGDRSARLREQRRNLAGRTGCGLCGTESLAQAIRPVPRLGPVAAIADAAIQKAVAELKKHQPLQAVTGATHAAAWCDPAGEILLVREDVGRHIALDKLIGAWVRQGRSFGPGFALISSRASFEMVQKSAAVGIGCVVAVSAPTALAIREAREAGMTLIGFARPGRHVIYTRGDAPGQPNPEEKS